MKSLEDILRAKAKSGDLNHLSVAYSSKGGWEVAYRGQANADHAHIHGDDVVDAMIEALTGRKAPKRAAPAKTKRTAPTSKPKAASTDDLLGDLM